MYSKCIYVINSSLYVVVKMPKILYYVYIFTSLANKLLVYKAFLKPIWTYGIQLWGTASNSNIDILERFQSKVLRIFTDAPWYVPSAVIKHDLQVSTVRQEVRTCSVTYQARLEGHSNDLATSLLQQPPHNRRLKRF